VSGQGLAFIGLASGVKCRKMQDVFTVTEEHRDVILERAPSSTKCKWKLTPRVWGQDQIKTLIISDAGSFCELYGKPEL
jgi:hypothetical protein